MTDVARMIGIAESVALFETVLTLVQEMTNVLYQENGRSSLSDVGFLERPDLLQDVWVCSYCFI